MLGLEHCVEPRCVMNDAEGSIKTVDNSTGELGAECAVRLDTLAPRTLDAVAAPE
jgi:archaemetzincin